MSGDLKKSTFVLSLLAIGLISHYGEAQITAAKRLLMVRPSQSAAPAALVSSSSGAASAPSSAAVFTITSTGSSHLLIVGLLYTSTTQCATSITDNAASGGNSYAEVTTAATDSTAGSADIWYATTSKSGATTLTINSTCADLPIVYFLEFSNLTALDASNVTNNHTASTTVSAPSVTTTTTHSVVFSLASVQNTITGLHTGNTFTALPILVGDDAGYLISTSISSYAGVWNQNSSGTYCAKTAAFK